MLEAKTQVTAKEQSSPWLLEGTSLQTAKSRLLLNTTSNLLLVILSSGIALALAPYLIAHLGLAAYGMVGLANSLPGFVLLTTQSITNSLLRHISIAIHSGHFTTANAYFNTAFKAIVVISGLLLIPIVFVSLYSSRLFDVPPELLTDTSWLILLVLGSCLIGMVMTPFSVVFQLTHRMFHQNVVRIVGMLCGVSVLVTCFQLLPPSMLYVGLYQLVSAATAGFILYRFQLGFQKDLVLKQGEFSWQALRALYGLAGYIIVDDLATLIFISANLLVVNKTLGPTACGQFAPIVLISSALMTFGSAFSNGVLPIMYQYVGSGNFDELRQRTLQGMRLVAGLLCVPVILICGFARPILSIWLGQEFTFLWPVVWALVLSIHFGRIVFLPFSYVYKGMNRVRTPAFLNLGFGLLNLLTVYILLTQTALGLIGLGLAFALTFGLRGVVVNSIYCGVLLELPWIVTAKLILPSLVTAVAASVILSSLVSSQQTPGQLALAFLISLVVFSGTSLLLLLTPADRKLLSSLMVRSVAR